MSIAASQAMVPEELVGIKSGRTRGGGLAQAHDIRRAQERPSQAGGRAHIMTLWPVLDGYPRSRSLLPKDRSRAGGSWSASTRRRDR